MKKQLLLPILAVILFTTCKKEETGCYKDFSGRSKQKDITFEYQNIVSTPPINGEKFFISFSRRGFFNTDSSQFDLDRGGYFVFYKINNELYMANVSGKWGQQSYGLVKQLAINTSKKVGSTIETSTFRWYYNNSYDSQYGCAIIKLTKTYQSGEMKFKLEMSYPEDEVIYEGFVDVF
ncbi:hypothetical protein BAX97_11875 [Elizabethkingia meningoseptica]|uniref:hypothetical protein n=1 Tax=Elizabethkingia meningoseptica TaxID=238 RepID=UPI00099949C9|nr:hypothetical protein [Elizabethkingia meningoseptica]OPC31980.1 hypothetical protein BAX97_11875 [Elizabethkingia meningoseptica]